MIAPSLSIDAALSMPLGRYMDLVGGRLRLLARHRAAPQAAPAETAPVVGDLPGGARRYRFNGDDGLRQLTQMLRAQQAGKGAADAL